MITLKARLIISFIIFISLMTILSAQDKGFVTTRGKEIITPDGKEIILKGMSVGNWLEPEGYMFKFERAESSRKIYEVFNEIIGPDASTKFWDEFRKDYINEDDIKFIKDHGFNSIRVPFDYKLFLHEDFSPTCDPPGFKLLDDVINWCSKYKIYVILDMHCAPGGQTGANIDDSWGYPYLYENAESQNLTINLWKEIANRYKNEKYILGYDLLNEPIAPYFNTEKLNTMLEPLYIKITDAIRTVDSNHIVILGGAQWNQNFDIFSKPFDPKLVYTFHVYWSDTTQSVIQKYMDFRDKYNVPMWLGESGENTMQWIASFRRLLENNDIGWCFWPFKRLDTDRCIVSINQPVGYDKIIEYANSNRQTFGDIKDALHRAGDVTKAVHEYLNNIKLKNCKVNEEYIKALGLK